MLGYFKNKKNGKIYCALELVINTTNAQDGEQMVHYINKEQKHFVREKKEFIEKFENA